MGKVNEVYYPELLTNTNAFPANIMFTFYERSSTTSSAATDIVHLYMPENFGQPSTVSWDHTFSGGQAVLGAAAGAAGGIGAIISKMGSKGAALTNWLSSAAGAIRDYAAPSSDLAQLKAGMTLNPYLTQLFRGVDLRNFQFTFRLTPFTQGDCDKIYEIIKIFRRWSLPSGPERWSVFYIS